MPSPSRTCWTNLAEEKRKKRMTEAVPEVPRTTGADPPPPREERGTWTVGTITTSGPPPAEAAQDQGALQGQEEEGSLRLLNRPLPLPRVGLCRQSRQTIYSVIKSKRRVSTTSITTPRNLLKGRDMSSSSTVRKRDGFQKRGGWKSRRAFSPSAGQGGTRGHFFRPYGKRRRRRRKEEGLYCPYVTRMGYGEKWLFEGGEKEEEGIPLSRSAAAERKQFFFR